MPQFDAPILRLRLLGGNVQADGPAIFQRGLRLADGQGEWARWQWDGATLLAENDWFGAGPLFYAELPDGVALSPSPMALATAGADARLDLPALAVFVRTGYYIGRDTPFRGIKAMPCGGRLTWTADAGLHVEERLELPTVGDAREVDDDMLREWAAAFQRAVESRLPAEGQLLMPISGGRDSRLILMACLTLGHKPDQVMCIPPPRPMAGKSRQDFTVALKLADRFGLSLKLIEPERRVPAERLKNRLTGYLCDESGWLMSQIRHLATGCDPADHVFDGAAGERVLGSGGVGPARQEMLRNRDWSQLAAHLMIIPEAMLARLIPSRTLRHLDRTAAHQRILVELERFKTCPNPVAAFLLVNRTRRELLLPSLLAIPTLGGAKAATTTMPFFDRETVRLGMSIPWQAAQGDLRQRILDLVYPQSSGLPFAKDQDNSPLSWDDRWEGRRTARDLARFALIGVSRKQELRLVKSRSILRDVMRYPFGTALKNDLGLATNLLGLQMWQNEFELP